MPDFSFSSFFNFVAEEILCFQTHVKRMANSKFTGHLSWLQSCQVVGLIPSELCMRAHTHVMATITQSINTPFHCRDNSITEALNMQKDCHNPLVVWLESYRANFLPLLVVHCFLSYIFTPWALPLFVPCSYTFLSPSPWNTYISPSSSSPSLLPALFENNTIVPFLCQTGWMNVLAFLSTIIYWHKS